MVRFYLVGDERKGPVREALSEVESWLRARAEVVGIDLSGDSDLSSIEADYVVIFGGDGSILSAARRMGRNQLPTLGVNLGRLGFLAEARPENARQAIEAILERRTIVEERVMLACTLAREGREVASGIAALNDVSLQRLTRSPIVSVRVTVGGAHANTYSGDGLIVATPTGSTAYSLAAGGPILHPSVEALILTPICPHAFTDRPVVISDTERLAVTISSRFEEAAVSIDGQVNLPFLPGDELSIGRHETPFRLVKPFSQDFYEILRVKLGWIGEPPYRNDGGPE